MAGCHMKQVVALIDFAAVTQEPERAFT